MAPPNTSPVLPLLWAYSALLAAAGFVITPAGQLGPGLAQIVLTEDALITDYMLVAGPGPALVNAGLVAAISIATLRHAHTPFDGSALVVVGLMSGFALFGKNGLNLWPILLGARLYAWYRREPFGRYAAAGLTATALAPVVSYFVLDNGWGTLPAGILAGAAIGFLLPALAAYTYRLQRGMNLYNTGFACGLAAFLIVPLMNALGAAPAVQYRWASGRPNLGCHPDHLGLLGLWQARAQHAPCDGRHGAGQHLHALVAVRQRRTACRPVLYGARPGQRPVRLALRRAGRFPACVGRTVHQFPGRRHESI